MNREESVSAAPAPAGAGGGGEDAGSTTSPPPADADPGAAAVPGTTSSPPPAKRSRQLECKQYDSLADLEAAGYFEEHPTSDSNAWTHFRVMSETNPRGDNIGRLSLTASELFLRQILS